MQPNQPKKVFKLKNQRKSNQVSEEEAFERMICVVGMNYPQYSLEQLRDEIPIRQLKRMFKEINRRRAETLLLLNGIINGPNSKSKSKSEYKNIIKELEKPGRDVRDELPPPMLKREVLGMEDLKPGMEIKGTVRNIIDFGAFVDIGIKEDGLVHVSRMSKKFIKDPSSVVAVGQIVTVWVYQIDQSRGGKVGLSMIELPSQAKADDK